FRLGDLGLLEQRHRRADILAARALLGLLLHLALDFGEALLDLRAVLGDARATEIERLLVPDGGVREALGEAERLGDIVRERAPLVRAGALISHPVLFR